MLEGHTELLRPHLPAHVYHYTPPLRMVIMACLAAAHNSNGSSQPKGKCSPRVYASALQISRRRKCERATGLLHTDSLHQAASREA